MKSGTETSIDKYMIISQSDDGSFPFQGIPTKEPAFQLDALWIDEKDKENADLQGFTVIEPLTVIATHLKEIIHAHAPELLGRQEVQKLLEGIKANNNVVIDELIRHHAFGRSRKGSSKSA